MPRAVWTYSLDLVWTGLQACYADLKEEVRKTYGVTLKKFKAMGFSAMMHGYLVFDKNGSQLAEFRTWRNTITGKAAGKLTELFQYNIPQRWSIAHLYQAILNHESHVRDIDFMTTLSGYVHWKLTGELRFVEMIWRTRHPRSSEFLRQKSAMQRSHCWMASSGY